MNTLSTRLAEVQKTLQSLDDVMINIPLFTVQAPGLEAEIRKMHEACRLAIEQAKLAKSIGND
jgi:hypothetical protein